MVWYTGQNGVYGRVDPATGKVDAWASPKGRGTYGITARRTATSGTPRSRAIISPRRSAPASHVVDPPRKGVGPRRIWSDSKGYCG
jgi:virginiamycin B lyase